MGVQPYKVIGTNRAGFKLAQMRLPGSDTRTMARTRPVRSSCQKSTCTHSRLQPFSVRAWQFLTITIGIRTAGVGVVQQGNRNKASLPNLIRPRSLGSRRKGLGVETLHPGEFPTVRVYANAYLHIPRIVLSTVSHRGTTHTQRVGGHIDRVTRRIHHIEQVLKVR